MLLDGVGGEEEALRDLLFVAPLAICLSTSRSRSGSGADGCSARGEKTVIPLPTIRTAIATSSAGQSFETKADAPAALRPEARSSPPRRSGGCACAADSRRIASHSSAPDSRPGTGPPAPRAARAARHLDRFLHARRGQAALRPGLLGSSSRNPQWTTSWSSTTSTRRLRSGLTPRNHPPAEAPPAVGAPASRRPPARTRPARRAGAPRRRPAAGPSRAARGTGPTSPSFRTSSTNAPSIRPTYTRTALGRACSGRFGAPRQHRLRERLHVLRHLQARSQSSSSGRSLLWRAGARAPRGASRRCRAWRRERRESASRRSASAACFSPAQRRRPPRSARGPSRARASRRTAAAPPARAARAPGRSAPGAAARDPAGSSRSGRWRRARRSCRASTGRGARIGQLEARAAAVAEITPSQRPAADTGTQQSVSIPPIRA